MLAASPGLEVDQGTVTWSNTTFYGNVDSPMIVVKGGTLILENDAILGSPLGSRPLIEVDGGTLVLGGPDGSAADALFSFGSEPYINVTGSGKVIDESGNVYTQWTSAGTLQTSGTTATELTSSRRSPSPARWSPSPPP